MLGCATVTFLLQFSAACQHLSPILVAPVAAILVFTRILHPILVQIFLLFLILKPKLIQAVLNRDLL